MTHEERIEAIENDIAELRANFVALTGTFIHQSGQYQAYRAALLALIAANRSEQVANDLREELARSEAKLVHECMAEGFLEGAQEAQNLILLALVQSGARGVAGAESEAQIGASGAPESLKAN